MTLGGAVLLAAGRGRRIGGRPKSLLRVDGDLLIHRQICLLTRLGVAPVVVVLGHHAEAISEVLAEEQGVISVCQPVEEHSQSSSLRLGLGALPETTSGVLVSFLLQVQLFQMPLYYTFGLYFLCSIVIVLANPKRGDFYYSLLIEGLPFLLLGLWVLSPYL